MGAAMRDAKEAGGFVLRTTRRFDAEAAIDLSKRRTWHTDPPADDAPPADDPPAGDPLPDDGKNVPDWVKDPEKALSEIRKLRGENAKLRTSKPKPEAKPDPKPEPAPTPPKPKTPAEKPDGNFVSREEFEKLQNDLQTERMTSLRLKVAADAGLPPELAARLVGKDEAELKADAEKLKPFAPQPEPDPLRRRTTTRSPDGTPVAETEAQKRARLFGR